MLLRQIVRQSAFQRAFLQRSVISPLAGGTSGYTTISDIPPSSPNPETPPSSLKERLSRFFKQYGKLGVGVYLSVSAVTLGSSYIALRAGLDVPGLLIKMGVPEMEWMKSAGTFAFAYALYKLALPLRLFVTVGLTGFISRRFRIGNSNYTKLK